MHLVSPGTVTLTGVAGPSLAFAGEHGEHLRVSVLDHDMIRVTHCPDGVSRLDRTWMIVGADGDTPREGRSRDDLSPFACPQFKTSTSDDQLQLHTDRLALTVNLREFGIQWFDAQGRQFAADTRERAYAYDRHGSAVYHFMTRRPDEHYYGSGEVSGPLDKTGMRLRMKPADALGYSAEHSDPLYKHWPFYITFIPALAAAYGLFYDSLAESVFDLGKEVNALRGGLFRYYQALAGDLDYTLIYGPTIAAVIEKFTALTGRPALPPRWSLGYLGSTMSYTEAPDAQAQLKQFTALCTEHDIPCTMFHLSSGYTTDSAGKRCVFTWNTSKVPDPRQMTADFHAAGTRLAANIKPYLLTTHPEYHDLAAQGAFVKAADTAAPQTDPFWSGGAYDFDEGAYVDFTGDAGFAWWKARVTDALLEVGIDAIWNDNNEFEVRDDAARCDGFGSPIPVAVARPLLTLLMARASYEALREFRPGKRPFLLTRSGCPGIQRYAQTWSGDNTTSWNTLRYNIPMGLGLGLSGMPNNGHDVGGFAGPKPDPELFVRWVQHGIFHPRFTIHSWNADGTVNEPWMYPDMLPLIRDAIRFRYRLIPYLYTLLVEAARTGHPITRPLVYHFPHDPRCATESFDFMLGPNLLVAPVLEPGARTRAVYLPHGTEWYDYHSGEWHIGGQTITVDTPLSAIPLFVPAGGIIPLGDAHPVRDADQREVRLARIYPQRGAGHSAFTLIEDDGESTAYQHGAQTAVTIKVETTGDTITLSVDTAQNGYALPYTEIECLLPPHEIRTLRAHADITARQNAQGWRSVRIPVRSLE